MSYRYDPYKRFGVIAVVSSGMFMITFWSGMNLNPYIAWMTSVNLVTFVYTGVDKRLAMGYHRRIPDVVFYVLFLSGGFIGGYTGMYIFRHKTLNKAYIIMLTVGMIIHLFGNFIVRI